MTDRIARMRQRLLEKQHHVHRQSLPEGDWPYRVGNLPDYWRTAQRFRLALELEQPVLLPEERIVLTRTVPNLPSIYDEVAWEDIRREHFIHENGVVCNISPDYGTTIARGLTARLREVETARARYLQACLLYTSALDVTANDVEDPVDAAVVLDQRHHAAHQDGNDGDLKHGLHTGANHAEDFHERKVPVA